MTDRLEDRIRDFLASRLDLLEPGLTFFAKEYRLASPDGAGGRVDIVAKDRFGQFVVIEIKRNDREARQAVHEIHKYAALFRIAHGLDHTSVRIMVVSTAWHELRLALFEYSAASPYTVEGFAIDVDTSGTVLRAERLALVPLNGTIEFSREQAVYLFQNQGARDRAISVLTDAVQAAHVADFIVLAIDHAGADPRVMVPFGLYLIIASPIRDLIPADVQRLKTAIGWDADLESPDENFLVAINRAFRGVPDTIEIGYPEKLTNIRRDWRADMAVRAGRLARPQSPLTDDELMTLAQGVGGGSPVYLYKLASPKFSAAWRQLRGNLQTTLLGMPEWQVVVSGVLDEVEKQDPEASLSIGLYNPANLMMSLYSIAARGDFSHCPRLEIVVEVPASREVRMLHSVLMWNGAPVEETPENIFSTVYGGTESWLMAVHFHDTFRSESAAMVAHRLVAPVMEIALTKGVESTPTLVTSDRKQIRRTRLQSDRFFSIARFADAHTVYLAALQMVIESHARG